MAVAFDAKSTADSQTNAGTSLTHNAMTVGSGANRALLVVINCSLPNALPSLSIRWDSAGTNQALSLITGATGTNAASGHTSTAQVWGLVAPTSGNKTLSVTWTGTAEVSVACVAFTGVNQTGGATSFPHGTGTSGSSASSAVTVTSATGNMVVAAHGGAISGNINSFSTGTSIYIDNAGTAMDAGGNYLNGAATVTSTASWSASGAWSVAGCDIAAASGGSVFAVTQAETASASDTSSIKAVFPASVIEAPSTGVTIDGIGAKMVQGGTTVTSMSYTGLLVGSDANAMIAMIGIGSNASGLTAVWDSGGSNQSMALLGSIQFFGNTQAIFGLLAPTTGTKTLLFNWTGTGAGNVACAVSFHGVEQSSNANAFKNYTSQISGAPGTSQSVTVSSAAGHLVIGQSGVLISFDTMTAGQTLVYTDSSSVNVTSIGEYTVGAPSVTLTTTSGSSSNWSFDAIDVVPAAGTGAIDTSSSSTSFLTSSISEATAAVDAPIANAIFPNARSEAASAIDTVDGIKVLSNVAAEAASAADTSSVKAVDAGSVTESSAATDVSSGAGVFASARVETMAAVDVVAIAGSTFSSAVSETVTSAVDTSSAIVTFAAAIVEIGTHVDLRVTDTGDFRITDTGANRSVSVSGAADVSSAKAIDVVAVAESASAADTSSGSYVFSGSTSEAASAVDVSSNISTLNNAVTEATTASDTSSTTATIFAVIDNESISVDTLSSGGTLTADSVFEAASGDDTSSTISTLNDAVAEAASAVDVADGAAITPASIAEAASAAFQSSVIFGFPTAIIETASAVDTSSATMTFNNAVTEAASAIDAVSCIGIFAAAIVETGTHVELRITNTGDFRTTDTGANRSVSVSGAVDTVSEISPSSASISETVSAVDSSDAVVSHPGSGVSISEGANALDISSVLVVPAPPLVPPQSGGGGGGAGGIEWKYDPDLPRSPRRNLDEREDEEALMLLDHELTAIMLLAVLK